MIIIMFFILNLTLKFHKFNFKMTVVLFNNKVFDKSNSQIQM